MQFSLPFILTIIASGWHQWVVWGGAVWMTLNMDRKVRCSAYVSALLCSALCNRWCVDVWLWIWFCIILHFLESGNLIVFFFFFIPCAFFSIFFFSLDIGGVHEQTCILACGVGDKRTWTNSKEEDGSKMCYIAVTYFSEPENGANFDSTEHFQKRKIWLYLNVCLNHSCVHHVFCGDSNIH